MTDVSKNNAWLPRQLRSDVGRRYRIGDVARLLNETTVTVRWWQEEFVYWVKPLRSGNQQRVYTEQTLSTLREIHRLLRVELYTIAGAKRQLRLAAEREKESQTG